MGLLTGAESECEVNNQKSSPFEVTRDICKIASIFQGDLENEKVVIVESSLSTNPIGLSVSDGTHTTDFSLEVRPSPPYVELTNNSHLVVSQGGQAVISSSNLYSDTNIDVRLQDIRLVASDHETWPNIWHLTFRSPWQDFKPFQDFLGVERY